MTTEEDVNNINVPQTDPPRKRGRPKRSEDAKNTTPCPYPSGTKRPNRKRYKYSSEEEMREAQKKRYQDNKTEINKKVYGYVKMYRQRAKEERLRLKNASNV